MDRRGFAGATLAGLGGFLLPVKSIFAKNNIGVLSSEEVWTQILSDKQYMVKLFLHGPISSKLELGLSTTISYDYLKSFCVDEKNGKISLLFRDHVQKHGVGWLHPTSNMKYIAVCPAKDSYDEDWIFYEHYGDDCWNKIENKSVMPWIK